MRFAEKSLVIWRRSTGPQQSSALVGGMVNMQAAGKGQRRPRRSGESTPDISVVNQATSHAISQSSSGEGMNHGGEDGKQHAQNGSKPDAGSAESATAPPKSPPRGLLTAEQETLMVEHLPIVRFIARRIHERLPQHVPIEDLYSAGVVGLLDAFGKFDPSKQVQFRSYAQFRIRGAILDSLRTLDWSPRELRRKGRAVEQAIQTLTAQFGRTPTDIEIAHQLHIDLAAYQHLLGELKGLEIGTLHSERSEDSGEEELVYLPNRPEDDPLFR